MCTESTLLCTIRVYYRFSMQFGNHSYPAMSLTESSLSLVLFVTTWVVVGVDHDALFLTSGKSSGVGAPRVISDIERSQSCAI